MQLTTIFLLRTGRRNPLSKACFSLCQKGCDQAFHAAIELSKYQFSAIFTSPLPYAWDTARIVQAKQALSPEIITLSKLTPSAKQYYSQNTIQKNTEEAVQEARSQFRYKTVLFVSHRICIESFIANHLGIQSHEVTGIREVEHGEWFCRQIPEYEKLS